MGKLWEANDRRPDGVALAAASLKRLRARGGVRLSVLSKELRYRRLKRRIRLGGGVNHIAGPPRVRVGSGELAVCCLLRDGVPWLESFLSHHRHLGASCFVFVDNGSSDETVPILRKQRDCTVFSTQLPFNSYKVSLKRWMVEEVVDGGWRLYCDIDELFDYPYSAELPLKSFLEYLDRHGYRAVVGQLLDMFRPGPLRENAGRHSRNLKKDYPLYDISRIREVPDPHWVRLNELGHPRLCTYTGGIRTRLGVRGSVLTKHPLLRPGPGTRVFAFNDHFVTGAKVADVSGVLLHYKFIGTFMAQVQEAVRRGQYHNGSANYVRYHESLAREPNLSLDSPQSRFLSGPEELVDSGFLVASGRFEQWVAAHRAAVPEEHG